MPRNQLRIRVDCIESGEIRDSLMLTFDMDQRGALMADRVGKAFGTAILRMFDGEHRETAVKAVADEVK